MAYHHRSSLSMIEGDGGFSCFSKRPKKAKDAKIKEVKILKSA